MEQIVVTFVVVRRGHGGEDGRRSCERPVTHPGIDDELFERARAGACF